MLSFEKLIEQENIKTLKDYNNSLEKIKVIWEELKDDEDKYKKYLFAIADKILFFAEFEQDVTDDYYKQNDLDILQYTNKEFYSEVKAKNYGSSYANP